MYQEIIWSDLCVKYDLAGKARVEEWCEAERYLFCTINTQWTSNVETTTTLFVCLLCGP
jgi:hypothetical protein